MMKNTARVNVYSGLVVTALGLVGLVESYRMPRFTERGIDPHTIPGLTPGILSAALALMGAVLAVRALGGIGASTELTSWNRGSVMRMALTLLATLVYGLLLFGNLHFVWATTLFIFVFTLGAELINPSRRASIGMTAVGALALALIAAVSINFIFTNVFLVRLPG